MCTGGTHCVQAVYESSRVPLLEGSHTILELFVVKEGGKLVVRLGRRPVQYTDLLASLGGGLMVSTDSEVRFPEKKSFPKDNGKRDGLKQRMVCGGSTEKLV